MNLKKCATATKPKAINKVSKECVILLHGIMRSKLDMLPLTRFLEQRGYTCLNILYPSRKQTLEELSEFVAQKIDAQNQSFEKLHFVTHSMGGLLARYYIDRFNPQNLGKVVMLSPPNQGSEFADQLTQNKVLSLVYKKLFGPAGSQLQTTHIHHTKPIDYELGIIAGTKNINPLAPFFIPKNTVGIHDGIVPVERTKIDGMRDHITMPLSHSFMMFNPALMEQVHTFLKSSAFRRTAKS